MMIFRVSGIRVPLEEEERVLPARMAKILLMRAVTGRRSLFIPWRWLFLMILACPRSSRERFKS